MARSAYYSRANSYSKSYNATQAENEGRFPRTRAARELELSVKAFDAGCKKAGYRTTEWHHVGKYANNVDYYDTVELGDNPLFWLGAMNRRNIEWCKQNLSRVLQERMRERMPVQKPQVTYRRYYYSDDEYAVEGNVTPHNVGKAIREIASERAKVLNITENRTPKYAPKRLQRFTLFVDGTILDRNGNQNITFSEIDWYNYNAWPTTGEGIRFVHVNN